MRKLHSLLIICLHLQTIDRRNLTVFEARKDDNGDESYMNWSTIIPMNLLYTGELNVADTLSVGDYTSYNSYKDLRKIRFCSLLRSS
mgnify:CR=1 FL=1